MGAELQRDVCGLRPDVSAGWILEASSHGRGAKGTSPCMHAWTKWPRWHEGSCSPPRGIRPKDCTGYLMVGGASILNAESPCLI